MTQLILTLLLLLPAYHRDREAPDARLERMTVVAQAIDSATLEATCSGPWRRADWCRAVWPGSRAELAALLVTIGFHESTYALRVGELDCAPGTCDDGAARGYWQVHRHWLSDEEWDDIHGPEFEPVATAAVGAARALGAGLRRCRSTEGAIASYAGVRGCSWAGTPPRMKLYRRARDAL